jgi:alcohol dehydrogenase class IV
MAKRKIAYPVYRQPSQVTFGTGSARMLAESEFTDGAVFMVSGQSGVLGALTAAFARHGMSLDDIPSLQKPSGEPSAASVTAGAAWLAERSPARIIAVGGGSVLDWSRLAMGVAGGWLDLATGAISSPPPTWKRPELVLVPTTCGSGAEAAAVAVYLADGQKKPVVSTHFIADRVILDGQFLGAFDAQSIAPFLCDALSHSIEAFVSIVPNALAKQSAASALPMILAHQTAADSYQRDRLMEAGYLAGVAASNCSVGVVHALAHALARVDVPHGVANAIGLRSGIAVNATTDEMGQLLARIGLESPDALRRAITPVVAAATANGHAARARAALADPAQCEGILTAMAGDVCLRTNPRRLTDDELRGFVAQVAADLVTP